MKIDDLIRVPEIKKRSCDGCCLWMKSSAGRYFCQGEQIQDGISRMCVGTKTILVTNIDDYKAACVEYAMGLLGNTDE